MFDFSAITGPGLSGFAGGLSQLGFTPPDLPTPAFGNALSLNNAFNTTLGPSGLMGTGGAPLSVTAGFSGVIGGDETGYQNAKIPAYGITAQQVPIYTYQNVCFTNADQTGKSGPVFVVDADCDGKITQDDLQTEDTCENPSSYVDGWQDIRDTLGTDKIQGSDLDKVKVWIDTDHDGKIDDCELHSPSEYGIVAIDTCNNTITRKQLVGYQIIPQQTVTGYYNFNTYSTNTGIDTQSFTFEPATAGSAIQSTMAGNADFAQLPPVPNLTGQPNPYSIQGMTGGLGWTYAWNGSGYGNPYGA